MRGAAKKPSRQRRTGSRPPRPAARPNLHRLLSRLPLAALSLIVAGCQSDTGTLSTTGNTLLSRGFVQSFASYEGAAQSLITSARYTIQHLAWYVDSNGNGTADPGEPVYDTFPLLSSGIHYAHAVDLWGRGQRIAIADGGFRTTHEAFLGKSLFLPATALPVDNHGTAVASVAAGNSPTMIGVAPRADLILGSFASWADLVEITDRARALGAVAFSNSWGVTDAATAANYNFFVNDPAGRAWLDSLRAYTANGVVVFAVSNDPTLTTSGLLEALPKFAPELEAGWLAVVNGEATTANGSIAAGRLISAGCLDAAPWCLTAEGAWKAATATSDTSYALTAGSSFAAPMVAGALALLAEAFPDLTPNELRIRLLAAANNSFAGFTADGSVELVPGFRHSYSRKFGHGFLDVKAALLPIGPTTLSLPGGTVLPLDRPIARAGRGSGNALARALAGTALPYEDGLGAVFAINAASRIAPAAVPSLGAELLDEWRGGPDLPATLDQLFPARTRLGLRLTGFAFSIAPAPQGATGRASLPSVTFSFSRPLAGGRLVTGIAFGNDTTGLMPGWTTDEAGRLGLFTLAWHVPLARGWTLEAEGLIGGGMTSLAGTGTPTPLAGAALRLARHDVARPGDRLFLTLEFPAAAVGGSATITLPTIDARGQIGLARQQVSLVPEAREMQLSFRYDRPLTGPLSLTLAASHAINRGNVAGARDTGFLFGLAARF